MRSASGTVVGRDALREPLGDRRLADAGRPHERRIVLAVAQQDVDDARHFLVAAAHGLEPAGARVGGQVAREARERAAGGFVSEDMSTDHVHARRYARVIHASSASPQNNVSSRSRRKEHAERHERRFERRGTERELGLFARVSAAEQRDRNHDAGERDGAERGAEEDRDERARGTERGADERHQRHVAKAHRLALRRHLAEPSDDGDHAGARARSDQRVVRRSEQLGFAAEERRAPTSRARTAVRRA